MSFILESLQRVQRDRRKGQAPDLEHAYRDSSILPRPKRRWPWVIALVLVVSAGVAGYLVWPKSPGPEALSTPLAKIEVTAAPVEETPLAAVSPSPTPPVPPATVSPPPAAPPAPPKTASPSPAPMVLPRPPAVPDPPKAPENQAISNSDKELPMPASQEASAAPGEEKQRLVARPLAQEAKVPTPLPPPTVAKPPDPETEMVEEDLSEYVSSPEEQLADDSPEQVIEEETVEITDPAKSPDKRLPEAGKPEPELDLTHIPLVKDLPPEIRDSLSALTINVHGYFQNPERRVVFINMQRYKVGDRIGNEKYLLEAITSEGVVINYGDGQARLLVKR